MYINKSIFLESLVCILKGWNLFHTYNNAPISIGDQLRMEEGKEIGSLARKLYSQGLLISTYGKESLQDTDKYLNIRDYSILFEAAFTNDKYTTRADILIRENDSWHLIEVKSSTDYSLKSKSEKVKYIDDMAYTLMVIDKTIPIKKISIMTLSKDYRLGMDLEKLFVLSDVTEEVIERKIEFNEFKNTIAQQVASDTAPKSQWIYGCKECEFFPSICLGKGKSHSIFNLPRITEKKCNELFSLNSYEINSIPESFPLTSRQMTIRQATVNNEPYLSENLQKYLEKIELPIYYLDFETFKTAFPLYSDVAPHEQVVTQYSLHCLNNLNDEPDHMDYLADPKLDCRRELAQHLIQSIGDKGSIIVYSSFEKTILKALRKKFPDLDTKLSDLISRLVDLKNIIENNYYHPNFYGSYSIKNVLPVLMPEMSYEDLAIKNGDEAIAIFVKMIRDDLVDEDKAEFRRQLLDYCCQDTLAMVFLHKKMSEMSVNF